MRGETEVTSWPVPACGAPSLEVVDGLARLQLAARRFGCSILLRDVSAELCELLHLAGLAGVLGAPAGLEAGREPEGDEQVGVEEVVVPDDPVA